jgi:excisionase family DNA binding protein
MSRPDINPYPRESQPARRLVTVGPIAELLQAEPATIYRLVREGRLPAVRLGRYLRFDLVAIERWIDAGGIGLDGER